MTDITIGQNLRRARQAKNKTLEEVAEAVPMSLEGLRRIETGKSKKPRNLGRIAEVLEVKEDELRQTDLVPLLNLEQVGGFIANKLPRDDIEAATFSGVRKMGSWSDQSFAYTHRPDTLKYIPPGSRPVIDPAVRPENSESPYFLYNITSQPDMGYTLGELEMGPGTKLLKFKDPYPAVQLTAKDECVGACVFVFIDHLLK